MPPKLDAHLEGRILKAAQQLWHTRGEHGLTLRAIAREAGTSTPTVYKRFRNKEAILFALSESFRDRLNETLFGAADIEEVFKRYVQYAEENPQEYQLLWRSWMSVLGSDRPRPGYLWFISQLAQRFGGNPDDYAQAFYAFFLLAHGTASLLTVPGAELAHNDVRRNFLSICEVLIKNIQTLRV